MTMMKKEYIIPQVEVVKIANMTLLAGSMGVTSDEIGWGGDGSGVTPGAPELPGMPTLPDSPLDITPEKLLGFPF